MSFVGLCGLRCEGKNVGSGHHWKLGSDVDLASLGRANGKNLAALPMQHYDRLHHRTVRTAPVNRPGRNPRSAPVVGIVWSTARPPGPWSRKTIDDL